MGVYGDPRFAGRCLTADRGDALSGGSHHVEFVASALPRPVAANRHLAKALVGDVSESEAVANRGSSDRAVSMLGYELWLAMVLGRLTNIHSGSDPKQPHDHGIRDFDFGNALCPGFGQQYRQLLRIGE
jgi:hypothetical protein